MIDENKRQQLERWVNAPAVFDSEFGKIRGSIRFGIRKPMAPGYIPLIECDTLSIKKVDDKKPTYWFTNRDQTIKVGLDLDKININEYTMKGVGNDIDDFEYTITRFRGFKGVENEKNNT